MSVIEQMLSGIMSRLNLSGTMQAARGYYRTQDANKELTFAQSAASVQRVDLINQKFMAGQDVSNMLQVHSTLETGVAPASSYFHPALGQQQAQIQQPDDLATLTGAIQEIANDTKAANNKVLNEVKSSEKRIKSYMDTNFQRKKGRKNT